MANYKNTALNSGQVSALQGLSTTLSISGTGATGSTNPFASLGSMNSMTISLDELHNPHIKKYQVMEIEEDLLALSATWYRLREATKQGHPHAGISKLTDMELFKRVSEEDMKLAASIRDYYSKKIMMWKLKGQTLTRFREDLNNFIHGDGKIFKEEMCPLVYRLPEFYMYDIEFDKLANEHNKIVKERGFGLQSKTLNLQETFLVGKRHSKRKEYWFSDQNDNLVTLSLMHDNPLLSLLDIASKSPLTITAKFNIRDRDNVQYMYCDKYTFS